jgi:branched-chain amino acid transport system permease protein
VSARHHLAGGAIAVAVLAVVPLVADGYQLSLGISLLNYAVLATAWALFSGPTRYVSLATSAFFGIGAYTVAVLGEILPWPLVLAIAGAIGVVVALLVGLSTLRLSGVYFVIFTFGLAELIRQVVIWYEVNFTRVLGRYIFVPITQEQIYWQLLALAAIVLISGWFIQRSRLGFALRIIGDDETVAAHVGINMTAAKLTLFAVSALFISVTGAILAPRWTYIEPSIAFNQIMAFQVLIMALLGGAERLYGPLLGVIPLTLLFEWLIGSFPNSYSILLGLSFMLIVYGVPNGVIGLIETAWSRSTNDDARSLVGLVRRFSARGRGSAES